MKIKDRKRINPECSRETVIQAEETSTETSKKVQALTRILFKRLWQEYRQEVIEARMIAVEVMRRGQTQGMYVEGTTNRLAE